MACPSCIDSEPLKGRRICVAVIGPARRTNTGDTSSGPRLRRSSSHWVGTSPRVPSRRRDSPNSGHELGRPLRASPRSREETAPHCTPVRTCAAQPSNVFHVKQRIGVDPQHLSPATFPATPRLAEPRGSGSAGRPVRRPGSAPPGTGSRAAPSRASRAPHGRASGTRRMARPPRA